MNDQVLLRYQQKWIADRSPVKIIEKSRRIGISWAEAADSVLQAAAPGLKGCNVWYVSYSERNTRTFIRDCAEWALKFDKALSQINERILRDEGKDILEFRIDFPSGHSITALSSKPSNLRGEGGKVILDEAAFTPDLPGLVKAAMAMKMWGRGQVCIISTHNGLRSYFNKLVEDVRADRKRYSLHRVTLDDALDDGLYRRICQMSGEIWTLEKQERWRQELIDEHGEFADEELFCSPKSHDEASFPSLLVESRMDDRYMVRRIERDDEWSRKPLGERRWEVGEWLDVMIKPILLALPEDERGYLGMDVGRTVDLADIAVVMEAQGLKRYCPLLIEMRRMPFDQQEQIFSYLVDKLNRFGGGCIDARGNGAQLAENMGTKYGDRIEQVKLTNDIYLEIVPRYRAALEDGMFHMPKDADVLNDHRMVRFVNGVHKIPETRYKEVAEGAKKGATRHGDSFVALVLGLHAAVKHPGTTLNLAPGTHNKVRAKDRNGSRVGDRVFELSSRSEVRSFFR
jgi:phage FluMu gp28-like protein